MDRNSHRGAINCIADSRRRCLVHWLALHLHAPNVEMNMPSHRCQHPTCTAFLPEPGYCPDHAGQHQPSRHTHYDQHQRDKEMKRFYDSAAWQYARSAALARQPWCSRCGKPATTVHHKLSAKENPAQRLDPENLDPMCAPCHSLIEAEGRTSVR